MKPSRALPVALAILLLGTLVAGCTVTLPKPVVPERPGYAWTTTTARPWILRTVHCSGCPESPGDGAHHLLAVWQDGSVLHLDYNVGTSDTSGSDNLTAPRGAGLTLANTSWEPYRDTITHLWMYAYAQAPALMTVVGLQARQLSIHDVDPVLQVIQNAVEQATDPGPPAFDCTDHTCPGAEYILVMPPKAMHVTLGHPWPKDGSGAWGTMETEMMLIQRWLDNPPADTRPVM